VICVQASSRPGSQQSSLWQKITKINQIGKEGQRPALHKKTSHTSNNYKKPGNLHPHHKPRQVNKAQHCSCVCGTNLFPDFKLLHHSRQINLTQTKSGHTNGHSTVNSKGHNCSTVLQRQLQSQNHRPPTHIPSGARPMLPIPGVLWLLLLFLRLLSAHGSSAALPAALLLCLLQGTTSGCCSSTGCSLPAWSSTGSSGSSCFDDEAHVHGGQSPEPAACMACRTVCPITACIA